MDSPTDGRRPQYHRLGSLARLQRGREASPTSLSSSSSPPATSPRSSSDRARGPRRKAPFRKEDTAILGGTAAKVRASPGWATNPPPSHGSSPLTWWTFTTFSPNPTVRTTRLVRPRGPAEQTRVNHHRRRRRPATPPPRPPAIDPGEAWKYRDDIGPDGRPVGTIDHPRPTSLSTWSTRAPRRRTRPVNAWVGPNDCFPRGEQHGHAKLTDADVVEVLSPRDRNEYLRSCENI